MKIFNEVNNLNSMLEIDISRISIQNPEAEEWFLRVWMSKWHPDALLAKAVITWQSITKTWMPLEVKSENWEVILAL